MRLGGEGRQTVKISLLSNETLKQIVEHKKNGFEDLSDEEIHAFLLQYIARLDATVVCLHDSIRNFSAHFGDEIQPIKRSLLWIDESGGGGSEKFDLWRGGKA